MALPPFDAGGSQLMAIRSLPGAAPGLRGAPGTVAAGVVEPA